MNKINTTLLAGLLLASLAGSASGATLILSDQYNVANSGSGFALGSGVNSGINPPTTRLTGTAASGLRYIKTAGAKTDTAHYITNSTKLGIARISTDSSTLSLSMGTGAYDFGPVLNTLAASPSQPAVYEVTINIANAAAGSQRCSFAISSTPGTAGNWDFAIQLVHTNTADSFYTLYKRVNTTAGGISTALNAPIAHVGTYANEVPFLIRVTDAGAETDANFNSRVQVSTDGGATWIYDTATDPDLPNRWRFPGVSRYIYWDIAGGAGPVTYDNFTLNWISGPTSAPRTWTGAGADNLWSSSANWGGVIPSTGDGLLFAGTTRQANTNDLVGLTVPFVTFLNGGFALYGNVLTNVGAVTNASGNNTFGADLAWTSTAAKLWNVAGGSELLLNNLNSVEVNGDHNLYGGGIMRVKGTVTIGQAGSANPAFVVNEGQHILDGGTFTSSGGYRLGSLATAASGAQTVLTNGATFTLTASGGNFRVGDSANPVTSRLAIDHSTFTMSGGLLGIPWTAGATGEVSQVGGTVSGTRLSFSESGAGQGAYTLKDGTLEAILIRKNTSAGMASISFDHAILRALAAASNAFMSGLNLAEIQSGGLTLEAQTDITIAQNLTGAGSLTNNAGNVTLTGANSYAGNTVVTGGKLILPTGKAYSTIQVADYAALGILQTAGKSLTNSSLALGFSTLSFDLGTLSNPTAPMLGASSIAANGIVTIELKKTGLGLTTGTIVLVDYDTFTSGGFGNFVLGTLPDGVSATLVHNIENSSIDLNITAVPGYRWTGAVNSTWDYATANWINLAIGLPSTYADGVATEFLDGANTGVVNLDPLAYLAPAGILVSNETLPYVWTGGSIGTSATSITLKKFGAAPLTRVEGGADIIGGIELNAGSFIFSNLYDVINPPFTTVLTDVGTGTGTFVKQGSGTLNLYSTNTTYDGAILIQEGLVKIGADRSLGSTKGGTTIASGATLDLNNMTPGAEPIIVSGAGVNGQGAIIDSTTGTGVDVNLRDVTMVGDTAFGCPNGGRWDIRVRQSTGPGPGLKGNGFNLTKVGSGSVSIACQRSTTGYWDMNLGDVFILQDWLTFAEAVGLGNPAKIIAVAPGATLGTYDLGLTNPIVRNIYLTNATIAGGGSLTDTNVFTGTINMAGTNNTLAPNKDAGMLMNGPIIGPTSLTISGDGGSERVFLNAVNTYSGDTTLNNATLGGTGVIPGSLLVTSGTLAPGLDGVGILTVNGNATLAGTTVMEVNRNLAPNSDRLVVGGTLTFGGTLQVVLAGTPQPGDVYQLFNKGSAGTFASILLPDLSGLPGAMSWDTSELATNGRIKVNGTATPPTIGTVSLSGGSFTFSGTGGSEGATYYIVTSPDVSAPMATWTPVATNVFGPGGSFSFATNLVGGAPEAFFRVKVP